MAELRFPDPTLSDGEVTLRPLSDDDIPALVAWGRDPEIVRWTEVPAGYTEDAARAWAASTEQDRRAGRSLYLVVADVPTNAVLAPAICASRPRIQPSASSATCSGPRAAGGEWPRVRFAY